MESRRLRWCDMAVREGRRTEAVPAVEPEEFSTQGDAESCIGETWKLLLDGGVDQVRLFEDDMEIYGPMSLRAATEQP
jgi:hypothetical protein